MKMENSIISETVLNEDNIKKIKSAFETEEKYRELMQALWKTRAGLMKIAEEQPKYSLEVFPQVKAINHIIGALYVTDLDHPIHHPGDVYLDPKTMLKYRA